MTADTSVLTVLTNAINAGRQITVAEIKYAIADAETRGYRQAITALRDRATVSYMSFADAANFLETGLLPEGSEL